MMDFYPLPRFLVLRLSPFQLAFRCRGLFVGTKRMGMIGMFTSPQDAFLNVIRFQDSMDSSVIVFIGF